MVHHPRRPQFRFAALMLVVAVGLPLSLPRHVAAESGARLGSTSQGSGATTGAWLVTLRPDVSEAEAAELMRVTRSAQIGQIDDLGVRVVSVPFFSRGWAISKLADDPRVLSVELDGTAQATAVPRDPGWEKQWGPRKIRAPEAWGLTTGDRGTIIAIVDTGVDAGQPDLSGRVLQGHDFQNNDANARDDNGHGTAVAGVAAAAGNNGVGIAGMCWKCRILPVKVLNANGSGSHSNIAAGIVWAANHRADVINLSLATATDTAVIAHAVAYARRKGAVVVAAAGNEGSRRKFYPAAYPGVISVAASNGSDRLYSWSNKGSWIKLAAPGCAYTTRRGRSWSWWCGTSFASPAVAGTVALAKSLRPSMTRSQLEGTVLGTAIGLRTVTRGRLDAARALHRAESIVPNPSPDTDPPPDQTVSDHEWQGDLSPDDRTDRRTFWMAGDVHVKLDWTGDTDMSIRVIDAEGQTVRQSTEDAEISFEMVVTEGEYRVLVGNSQPVNASYTVLIDQ
jgi:subtilisin family serine protease